LLIWIDLDPRIGEVRMAAFAKVMVCLATRTARPDWTLAALASLLAAGLLASLRFAFG